MKRLRAMLTAMLAVLVLLPDVVAAANLGKVAGKLGDGMSVIGQMQTVSSVAGNPDICWKTTYGRPVAGPPINCRSDEENQAGLCYPKCKPGYKGVGVGCWQECPAGYRDDGLTCAKLTGIITRPTFPRESVVPATFVRNVSCPVGGGPEKFWDGRNGGECWSCPSGYLRGAPAVTEGNACYRGFDTAPARFLFKVAPDTSRGEIADPRNGGEIWTCPSGYHRTGNAIYDQKACVRESNDNPECNKWASENFGTGRCEQIGAFLYPVPPQGTSCTANSCMKNCPPGYRDDGIACAKTTNYTRNVRTPDCPPGQEWQAGLCYNKCKDGYDGVGVVCWGKCYGDFPFECGAGCASNEIACAMSITEQVVGVLDVAVTTIETAATFGAGTAINAAIKEAAGKAVKEGVKVLVKDMLKNVTKKVGKDAIKKELTKELKGLAKDTAIGLAEAQTSNLVALMTEEPFDATTLDPTGISGMVKSFVKPICGDPSQLVSAGGQPVPPAKRQWVKMIGSAVDVGMGGGALWVLGTNQAPGGYGLHRWDPKARTWIGVNGGAVRIDVDPQGNPWVVNNAGQVFRWSGSGWIGMPGNNAQDIGVGANGTAWYIGGTKKNGGYGIHRWNPGTNKWDQMGDAAAAKRIDVDPKGNAWVVNEFGQIWRWNGSGWDGLPGKARDIGIGADGSVFVVGDNNTIHKWDESRRTWIMRDGLLNEISVSENGEPVGVNNAKDIWAGYQ